MAAILNSKFKYLLFTLLRTTLILIKNDKYNVPVLSLNLHLDILK